jgi:hypothetical protein
MAMDEDHVITIPPTTRERYLGGQAALNLPLPEGTGDWHMVDTFFMTRATRPDWHPAALIFGKGCRLDTNPLLGDIGIYDCTDKLDELGIPHESKDAFAADHARAIADLVLCAVMEGGNPAFVILDDWMPGDEDKQKVYELLERALAGLTLEQKDKVLAWKEANPF